MKQRNWRGLFVGSALVFFFSLHGVAQIAGEESAPEGRNSSQDRYVVWPILGGAAANGLPTAIGSDGTVVGIWSSGVEEGPYGFYRSPDGTFTSFDLPGTVSNCNYGVSACPGPVAINAADTILGSYSNGTGVEGFLRDSSGNLTDFSVPTAYGTYSAAINSAGAVTGYYLDSKKASHGFLRSPAGRFTTFDVPGAVCCTAAAAINDSGDIVGNYEGAPSGYTVGFLRDSNGNFTVIAPPGASQQVLLSGIDDQGRIIGSYVSGDAYHGFLRDKEGNYTTFSVPDTVGATFALGVDKKGTIAGQYSGTFGATQSFYRLQDGKFGLLSPHDAATTSVLSINVAGEILGTYQTSNYFNYAFILAPQ